MTLQIPQADRVLRALTLAALFFCYAGAADARQAGGTLTGRVNDQLGGLIVGAGVTLVDASGIEMKTTTDAHGRYTITAPAPGTYTVRIEARGFELFEQAGVVINDGARKELDVQLSIGLERQEIRVGAEGGLSTEPERNAGALVLRGTDMDALPEDSEELAAALQALAGAPASSEGGQFLIDGFLNTGEPLPPRSSIREVRINQNPFSAEHDRLGFGQIQIITAPGTETLSGQASFNFTDESLNARNPFTARRGAYQMRNFSAHIGGPIVPHRASFFLTFDRRATDDNAIINAFVLDEALNVSPFVRTVLVPRRQMNASARFDFQLNSNHTLTAHYNFYRNRAENAGVGGISLSERAFSFTLPVHTFQLTETAVVGTRVVNEFRLQYIGENQVDEPLSARTSINVLGAFAGGGSNAGRAGNPEGRLIVQNSTLWTVKAHTLRAGARLRRTTISDTSPDDFNGTFTFAGGIGPRLDANGNPLLDASGQIVLAPLTSIERYRRTLLLGRLGFTPSEIRARGGGATQLVMGGGNPLATARQVDFGAYLQDDWRVRPNVTLSLGLRYEVQTNISANLNLAPRIAVAWSPGLKGGANAPQPRTIIRAGFGVFFDRFNENQVLLANKYAAGDFLRFTTNDPRVLDAFPALPSLETLRAAPASSLINFRIADDLRAPYMMQAALGIERQLPHQTTLTVTYVASRTLHALRTRNVNAPVVVRNAGGEVISRARPLGVAGEIFQYESSGRLNQNQLLVIVNNRFSRRVSIFANYTLGKATGDTDGVRTYPSNSYDLQSEYGRSSFDVRHAFSAGATIVAPFGLRLSPLVFASTGRPFNITNGADTNGDALFTDRPAFATDLTRPSVRITQFGALDAAPLPGQTIIPRNFGTSPGYFIINLNVSRTFFLGGREAETAQGRSPNTVGSRPPQESRYRLTLGARILNLTNRVNFDLPVGNLSSPFFGQSVATAGGFGAASVGNPAAGNRRIEAQFRIEF